MSITNHPPDDSNTPKTLKIKILLRNHSMEMGLIYGMKRMLADVREDKNQYPGFGRDDRLIIKAEPIPRLDSWRMNLHPCVGADRRIRSAMIA